MVGALDTGEAPVDLDPPMETASVRPRSPGWTADFAWRDGRIEIRKTAIRLKPDRHLLAEVISWVGYLALLAPAMALARIRRTSPLAVRFVPEQPRPWYLVRGAALWAGARMTSDPRLAAATFYFDDVTVGSAPVRRTGRDFNFGCTDVSKSHVAEVFEEIFGYPLSQDPETAVGAIVEKSEKNGVHDGAIVTAPLTPRPGYVYQRLVDTTDDDGCCQDLRTPCVGGEPVLVWVKTKAAGGRFAIHNRHVSLREPQAVFSTDELATIRRFNARMGLDWGGLDILRDRHDGRIYVVDVNKTDVGPIIALSWRDKIRSMTRLAAAFERLVAGCN